MLKTILATTDLSARSDRALRRALRLAREHDAALTVLHVVDDATPPDIAVTLAETIKTKLERFMQSLEGGADTTIEVVHGDPIIGVVSRIKTMQPDLLVMGTHRVRPFFDSLRETTAQRIARLANCPLLLVKDADDHPYDTILAATDFTPAAAEAIQETSKLAPGAKITPVHAFHVPFRGMMSQTDEGRNEIEASFRSEAVDDDTRWRDICPLPDNCGETEFLTGQPSNVITNRVSAGGISLICAGAHGRVGQRRPVLGSTAVELLRDPPCDLLIVHPA